MISRSPPTIVVVDDDPDIVEFLCDYLPGMNCGVVSCCPGPQAAACIAKHVPSLVILDVEMGDTTGIDLFLAMRADATTRQVPVIFFTANPDKLRHALPHYHTLDAALVVKPDIAGLGARIRDIVHHHA